MVNDFKIELAGSLTKLVYSGEEHNELFNHGSLEVELYKPAFTKLQVLHVHEKDEVYIIASGKSKFVNETKIVDVERGDFLFVPTGNKHGFFEQSDDFSSWVLFYGPRGGEK